MPTRLTHSALRRWISRILIIAPLVIIALIVKERAYVTTYRLYLDARAGSPERSAAAQQFDIVGRQVVPRIVTRARIGSHSPAAPASRRPFTWK